MSVRPASTKGAAADTSSFPLAIRILCPIDGDKEKQGRPLVGGSTYRLTVPPDVPVTQFWSATVYDRSTHGLVREVARASRSSQSPDLQVQANRSVDIYFGPAAPPTQESNWVPTSPHGEFEVLFRFYGPEKSLFAKTWRLPDIEKI
jgi:hypothetical protein